MKNLPGGAGALTNDEREKLATIDENARVVRERRDQIEGLAFMAATLGGGEPLTPGVTLEMSEELRAAAQADWRDLARAIIKGPVAAARVARRQMKRAARVADKEAQAALVSAFWLALRALPLTGARRAAKRRPSPLADPCAALDDDRARYLLNTIAWTALDVDAPRRGFDQRRARKLANDALREALSDPREPDLALAKQCAAQVLGVSVRWIAQSWRVLFKGVSGEELECDFAELVAREAASQRGRVAGAAALKTRLERLRAAEE